MVSFHRVSVFSYLIIKRIYSTLRFKRGAKACLRVVVEVLTGGFSAVLVNQYFSDNEGKELNLASHNRVPSYDDCKNELKLLLAQTA